MTAKHRLKYTIEFQGGEFTPDDIKTDNEGLADAFLGISILMPSSGEMSTMHMHYDGIEKQGLSKENLFKVWSLMGMSLSHDKGLPPLFQDIVDLHARAMREAVGTYAREENND